VKYFFLLLLVPQLALAQPTTGDCTKLYGALIRTDYVPGVGHYLYLLAEKEGLRDFDGITRLKIGQFNPETLYNYSEKFVIDPRTGKKTITRAAKPKPEKRWKINKRVMDEADNDLMVWQEVDDLAAAKNFVDQELEGKYRVILVEGQGGADKSMEVALLVKKDLPFDLEVQSHKDLTYFNRRTKETEKLQSRDLLLVKVRRAGADPGSTPLFALEAGHYRSMRPRVSDPRKSIKKRTLQYHHALEVKRAEEKKFPGMPIFLVADFNSNLRHAAQSPRSVEANMLFHPEKGDLTDAFDLGKERVKPESRITHSYHPYNGKTEYTQLDGILLNRAAADAGLVESTSIIPFRRQDGTPFPLATTQKEREAQGSDHRMVQTILDFKKLRKLTE
jgi:hypothetical protein